MVNSNLSRETGEVFTLDIAATNGTVTLNEDGSYNYTPDLGYVGADSFSYFVTNSKGFITNQTVNITVAATGLEKQNITGTEGNDIIYGKYSADILEGGDGDDVIIADDARDFENVVYDYTTDARQMAGGDLYSGGSSIASLGGGRSVLVWAGIFDGQTSNYSYGQIFDENSNPVADKFKISSKEETQSYNVAVLDDGSFVVTWRFYKDGVSDIYARHFDNNGVAIGEEFKVNSVSAVGRSVPSISSLNDGGYVITWASASDANSANNSTLLAKIFDLNDEVEKTEFIIDDDLNIFLPNEVAGLKNGGFVVTWTAFGKDGSENGIYAQQYKADGEKEGDEFLVNTYTNNDQSKSTITALDDGGYVIIWNSNGQHSNYMNIGQKYDASGNTVGDEFFIYYDPVIDQGFNTPYVQDDPHVASIPGGGFVIIRSQHMNGSSGYVLENDLGIFITVYDGDSNIIDEVRVAGEDIIPPAESAAVNNVVTEGFRHPSVTVLDDGSIAVSWESLLWYQRASDLEHQSEVYTYHKVIPLLTQNDTLSGGLGDDILDGGVGDDVYIGGGDSDKFVISKDAGSTDIIKDFAVLESGEVIDLTSFNDDFANFAALRAAMVEVGSNVEIDLTNGQKLILENVSKDQLNKEHFVGNVSINSAPATGSAAASAGENGGMITGSFAGSDVDGDALTYVIVTDPAAGSVVNNGDGTFSFDPGSDFEDLGAGETRDVTFSYKANDGTADSSVETVTITVTGTNDAPTSIALDNLSVDENASGAVIGNLTAVDVDAGDSHIFSVDDTRFEVVNGQLKLKDGVSLDYETEPEIAINVTATDSAGAAKTQNFVINVGDVNESPKINAAIGDLDILASNEFIYEVAADAFSDIDGDSLTYTATLADGSALPDWMSFNGSQFAGTPMSDHVGSYEVKITASDGSLTASQNFTFGVNSNVINGTDGDDTLNGTAYNDEIHGGSGNNNLSGGQGDDKIYGEGTNNYINGGAGADYIEGVNGWSGAFYYDSDEGVNLDLSTGTFTGGHATGDVLVNIDSLIGSNHADNIIGNDNGNYLQGNAGDDVIKGEGGNDYMVGDAGNDQLFGGSGDDFLIGNAGDDVLDGGDGDDNLQGDSGNNSLTGGDGSDNFIIHSHAGTTTIITDFNLNSDKINLKNLSNRVSFAGLSIVASGYDTIIGLENNQSIILKNIDSTDISFDNFIGLENKGPLGKNLVAGTDGDDTLNGTDEADEIYGYGGTNHINAGAGDDSIFVSAGNNYINGGAGADYIEYNGNGWAGVFYYDSDEGVNLDLSTGTFTGGHATGDVLVNIDSLIGSNHADNIIGNDNGNYLQGNAGDDVINGNGGNDYMVGDAGNDQLFGGSGNDALVGGAGADVITTGIGEDSIDYSAFSDSTAAQHDIITDFEQGHDILNLRNLGITFDDLAITNDGINTRIAANDHDFEVELLGVHNLDENDFSWG
ncbi:Ig-like domain-containing protein [Rickettsiales bacterium]|nr:Ig-like domain-containing protein [Rickettsiales bacterium]